jgi:hypothetical protein
MMGEIWIDVVQDRDQWRALMNRAMKFPVPYTVGDLLSSWDNVAFSRRTELLGIG